MKGLPTSLREAHTREVFAHEFTNWADNLVIVDYEDEDEEEQHNNHLSAKDADNLDEWRHIIYKPRALTQPSLGTPTHLHYGRITL